MELAEFLPHIVPLHRKNSVRPGQITDGKCNHIKMVLGCEKNPMSNLSALKNNEMYKGIIITEDLIQSQRTAYKQLADIKNDRMI